MEILYQQVGVLPRPVFDTQIAAKQLGYGDQLSYAALVQQIVSKAVAKTQTRTDWSRRPLSAEQLQYAAADVAFLGELHLRLRAQLIDRELLDVAELEFATLSDRERYDVRPEHAWRKVKGAKRLHGRQLRLIVALADWREREAVALDRPRRWVINDDALLALARFQPTDDSSLRKIRGIGRRSRERYGIDLLAIIAEHKTPPSA